MNTTAIHQALRLKKQAEDMAWLCFPDSELPEGINDLLRIAAQPDQLEAFAKKNELDLEELSGALFHFIELVMLNDKNSDEKILGVNTFSTAQAQKFHYQLLMKIYHPDVCKRTSAEHYSSLITSAYQQLKAREDQADVISFTEQRKAPPSYYQATQVAESQISNAKTAIAVISLFTICTLVAMTGKFIATPEAELAVVIKEQQNVVEQQEPNIRPMRTVSSVKENTAIAPTQAPLQASSATLQALLKNLEIAYEEGNVKLIKSIIADVPDLKDQTETQLNDKLENIFKITSERKMVLFDFNWTSISDSIEGEGKFISRYQLSGEKKWLSREGVAKVIVKQVDNKLQVTQLELENQDVE